MPNSTRTVPATASLSGPPLFDCWIYPGSTLVGGVSHVPVEYSDGRVINALKPQYWHINSSGVLVQDTVASSGVDGYTSANAAAIKAASIAQYVTVSGNAPGINTLAGNSTLLTNFNNTLISFLGTVGFTGIELDFEETWNPGSGGATNFAALKTIANSLGTALHGAGYKLAVTGPAISTALQSVYSWLWSDFQSMPVDYLCPQCYDHFYDTNGLGDPGAPLTWIVDALGNAKSGISDITRIVAGLNSHGWHGTTGSYSATYDDYVQSTALTGFSGATRNAASGEMMWATGGVSYNYSDNVTLDGKKAAVYSTGIVHISVWHLGGKNFWFTMPRVVPTTAALLQTSTRTINSVTAAMLQPSTRSILASAAMLATRTRTIPATVSLSGARTIPATASLGFTTGTRGISATTALLATSTRMIPCAASLKLYVVLFPTVSRRTGQFPARARRGCDS